MFTSVYSNTINDFIKGIILTDIFPIKVKFPRIRRYYLNIMAAIYKRLAQVIIYMRCTSNFWNKIGNDN